MTVMTIRIPTIVSAVAKINRKVRFDSSKGKKLESEIVNSNLGGKAVWGNFKNSSGRM